MNSTRLVAALSAAALLGVSSLAFAQAAEPDLGHGQKLFSLCQQCHGDAGQGNQSVGAPAIAGMPSWYVKEQLRKFTVGLRGKHFDDIEGMRMRPMSLWLVASRRAANHLSGTTPDPNQVDPNIVDVAAYVETLPHATPPVTVSGDVANGEASYALCGSCHGMKGEGSEPQSAPPLAGQSDWYVLRSLAKYKAMTRGYDGPNDPFGATMAGMSNVLADDQAMRDVVAYIATLKK